MKSIIWEDGKENAVDFSFWGQNLIKLTDYIYFKLGNAYFITSIAVQQLLQKLNTSFCLPHWEQTRLAFLLLF